MNKFEYAEHCANWIALDRKSTIGGEILKESDGKLFFANNDGIKNLIWDGVSPVAINKLNPKLGEISVFRAIPGNKKRTRSLYHSWQKAMRKLNRISVKIPWFKIDDITKESKIYISEYITKKLSDTICAETDLEVINSLRAINSV
jgi:hypothetical protein